LPTNCNNTIHFKGDSPRNKVFFMIISVRSFG
jgi:hypothetical protein